jgi:catechol 2,3-dioxygenase-like lactoylglutathione lyase family enzyme
MQLGRANQIVSHGQEQIMIRFSLIALLFCLGSSASAQTTQAANPPVAGLDKKMQLGNFSISLAVKDIAASRAFYEKLGFRVINGDQTKNWLILQNESATIGLFQGMFNKNVMTFNPGWDRSGGPLPDFDDVRDLQRALKKQGITPATGADEATTGPASLMLTDPDGNPILLDQHVPKPKK